MDGDVDYAKYTEAQLLQIIGRIDPHRYPVNFSNLKARLLECGYTVGETINGRVTVGRLPGLRPPSIELPNAIEFPVRFDLSKGPLNWLGPSRNDFLLVGSGTISINRTEVVIVGRRYGVVFGLPFAKRVVLNWADVVNVESEENVVRFESRSKGLHNPALTLWLADSAAAAEILKALPTERSSIADPQLPAHVAFERRLIAESPRTPVTYGLVAINFIVFALTLVGGSAWFSPDGNVQIAWGSNFGPYTTGGEWWRLFTSSFVHFGVIHLLFNMWALVSFGSFGERLYGSLSYTIIYFLAGLTGSLSSIAWRPDINSAGASGAIFGILGALLAVQFRSTATIPRSARRPFIFSTLIFTTCVLAAGFVSTKVDNAAHVGGLIAGLLVGLVLFRPFETIGAHPAHFIPRTVKVLPVAAFLIGGGIWCTQRAPAGLSAEDLYAYTFVWFQHGEDSAVDKWVALGKLATADKWNDITYALRLKSEVLPFWQQASARMAAIHLQSSSTHFADAQLLRIVADGRVHALELCVRGLQQHDAKIAGEGANEMVAIDARINKRVPTPGGVPKG